jgi:hypothetical protein
MLILDSMLPQLLSNIDALSREDVACLAARGFVREMSSGRRVLTSRGRQILTQANVPDRHIVPGWA